MPREGLSETFVDPALAVLRARGAEIRFGARLRALNFGPDRITGLVFDADTIGLGDDDRLILAVPATVAARIVPTLTVPDAFSPIVNAHFRCAAAPGAPLFVGVVDGVAQWIFRKREVLSVTVSAADRIVDHPADALRESLWRDVALAYRLPAHFRCRRRESSRSDGRRFSPARNSCGADRPQRQAGRTFCSPAITRIPACPRPSKALSARALPLRGTRWPRSRHGRCSRHRTAAALPKRLPGPARSGGSASFHERRDKR